MSQTAEPNRLDPSLPGRLFDHGFMAMKSCKHMEIDSNGETFTLTLSPIAFGGPKSAAVRMDGTLQGVQIDAYLAIDRVGPAELAYFFLQVGSGSSQVASFYFRLADAKAQQQLNTFA